MSGSGDLDGFLAEAGKVVGERHVLTDPADTAGHVVDWTRRWTGSTGGVVRPADTDEVAGLVAAARRYHVALVAQGGNTGLVGGAIPQAADQVVVDLRRLSVLAPVDELAAQVTVGAGVTLAALQAHARAAGLRFGVDLGARDSATVGGMVATNAGGLHVVRFGAMRSQVVGVEAVLGTGAVVSRLSGLVKDNTGYDLAQLLCGSEGTLGLVTKVRLRLVPPPGEQVVGLLAVDSVATAVALAAGLRRHLPGVQALELMDGDNFRLVADHLGVPPPVAPDAGAFLLVEVEGADDPTEGLARALANADVLDAAVATSGPDRARLWRFREAHSEVGATFGVVHKLDVTLPTAAFAEFCVDVRAEVAARWPDAVTLLFGHVGDGNVHVNVVLPETAGADSGEELDDLVLGLVVARGGSISAEHGIGIAKQRWLARDRSPDELSAMRAIKAALDPDGILNPSVLLGPP
ncbi:MAG TPA: FAD-binding oxidoreductase [Acidimicrobiales bacterium]|nr:FAD-binding oxidoreductase [Acidimicrobiales bacterium]